MTKLDRARQRLKDRTERLAERKRQRDEAQSAVNKSKAQLARRRKWRDKVTIMVATRRRKVAQARKAVEQASHGGALEAMRWATTQIGNANESPPGSNWSEKIGEWIKASGYTFPVPWCQCFVNAVAVHGGAPQLRTGYTPYVLAGTGDYRPVSAGQARPGDFVFFKWPGVSGATCDHVGVLVRLNAATVTCIEGNTSPGTSGSQNDGGGTFLRTRPRGFVAGYVHPPYSGA